jgi:hypothetical protein
MIRLVHQFDTPRTRPSVAAPKSGGCTCCCCCCIVTFVGASVLTAAAVGRDRRWGLPLPYELPPIETEAAPGGSIYRPVPQEVPVIPDVSAMIIRGPHWGWRVFGFFLFPLAVMPGFFLGGLGVPHVIVFAISIGGYITGLVGLKKNAGLPIWAIIVLILGIPLLSILEVACWIGAA